MHAEILGAAIDNIFPVFRFLFLQFQVFFDVVVRISLSDRPTYSFSLSVSF